MTERHDIWHIADALQMDIRAASAKLVELRAKIASLDLPAPSSTNCPNCGIPLKGPRTLAEHLHLQHDGPEPDHYEESAQLADEPVPAAVALSVSRARIPAGEEPS